MPLLSGLDGLEGPLVPIRIEVNRARRNVLQRPGLPVPAAIDVMGLIDTGSHMTGIDGALLQSIDPRPIGSAGIRSPVGSAARTCAVYAVGIVIPYVGGERCFHTVRVLDFEFDPDETARALLGRDLLQFFHFTYNGPGRSFQLAW